MEIYTYAAAVIFLELMGRFTCYYILDALIYVHFFLSRKRQTIGHINAAVKLIVIYQHSIITFSIRQHFQKHQSSPNNLQMHRDRPTIFRSCLIITPYPHRRPPDRKTHKLFYVILLLLSRESASSFARARRESLYSVCSSRELASQQLSFLATYMGKAPSLYIY